MEYWLYNQIVSEESDREPRLALLSTINWAKALAFEIEQEHGATPQEQYQSCLQFHRSTTQGNGTTLGNAAVFEPLFSSLNNTLTLVTLSHESSKLDARPWIIPGLIVCWYYAVYTSIRAILAANNIGAPDTHTGVIKTLNNSFRNRLPHPLNMQAKWLRNEEFSKELPSCLNQQLKGRQLISNFDGTRKCAQEMLIGYLSGTIDREAGIIKERLKSKHKLDSFRTKAAKQVRDDAFKQLEANFMSCAFRYRGKANYRDAIYISYGARELVERNELVGSLTNSARFAFLNALAFITYRVGPETTKKFILDVTTNLRGIDSGLNEERFWMNLVS